jgi:ABC-type branched-subunit amino acid transport system ATPase component
MLSVRDLRVQYRGSILGLRNATLDVPEGAIVAVLGSNGAGKTTLLRAISGVLATHGGAVAGGTVELEGQSLIGRSPATIVGAGVVQVPEGRRIFERLTVAENLRVGGFATRATVARVRARRRVYELFPILYNRRQQRAGLLSGGEQQMLAIGRAMMSMPRLLLLDEPSLGLAPRVVGQIGQVITEINASGTTVMLVEQNAAMALSVASHAFVLTTGEVTLAGPAAELAANDSVRDSYLAHDMELAVDRELADDGALTSTGQARPTLRRWTE